VTYAFSPPNPFGAKLGAILSSDVSHFDVPDMTVLEEAWKLVEEKGMSEEDFHAFSFCNAVRLWASLNPDFFKGTVVEKQARQLIKGEMAANSLPRHPKRAAKQIEANRTPFRSVCERGDAAQGARAKGRCSRTRSRRLGTPDHKDSARTIIIDWPRQAAPVR
jgi:hypothetical protein